MTETRVFDVGDFRVQEYGRGEPRTLCIGGMSYAPNDYAPLASRLEGTVFVADNPYQARRIPWTTDFVAQLRRRYVELAKLLPTETLIAHSCGSFDALHTQEEMPDVRRMVLMTPPNGTRQWVPESSRLEEFGFLDRCLADLCKDVPDELYRAMLEEHRRLYAPTDRDMKALYKHEMPARRLETVEGLLELMRASRKDLLVVFGKQDPWRLIDPGTVDHGARTTVRQIDTGHFPHVSRPDELTELIRDWMRNDPEASSPAQSVTPVHNRNLTPQDSPAVL